MRDSTGNAIAGRLGCCYSLAWLTKVPLPIRKLFLAFLPANVFGPLWSPRRGLVRLTLMLLFLCGLAELCWLG